MQELGNISRVSGERSLAGELQEDSRHAEGPKPANPVPLADIEELEFDDGIHAQTALFARARRHLVRGEARETIAFVGPGPAVKRHW